MKVNIKIKPIVTEKSLAESKGGRYTFRVPVELSKAEIREAIGNLFSVKVTNIKTMRYKGENRRNVYRKKVTTPSFKKAIVTLEKDQKIEIFSEKK